MKAGDKVAVNRPHLPYSLSGEVVSVDQEQKTAVVKLPDGFMIEVDLKDLTKAPTSFGWKPTTWASAGTTTTGWYLSDDALAQMREAMRIIREARQ